jgi:ectoine hydroxylase-related dioxygenase (phytanoyl-CoA dioxygenase family)
MTNQNQLSENGFSIVENIYSEKEIEAILNVIDTESKDNWRFRKNKDLFAIRCFLKEIPTLNALIFNENLRQIIHNLNPKYRVVKSIYFDKPPRNNWDVNWHQDLTISVSNKDKIAQNIECIEIPKAFGTEGYKNWLPKDDYYSVQPTSDILEDIVTIRIHLDDCNVQNGALRVLPKSHLHIHDYALLDKTFDKEEVICEVKKGGILMMKPLIFHSSKRTENAASRRVIHIEFSSKVLPKPLIWHELTTNL